jgi:hypothetical protein
MVSIGNAQLEAMAVSTCIVYPKVTFSRRIPRDFPRMKMLKPWKKRLKRSALYSNSISALPSLLKLS